MQSFIQTHGDALFHAMPPIDAIFHPTLRLAAMRRNALNQGVIWDGPENARVIAALYMRLRLPRFRLSMG